MSANIPKSFTNLPQLSVFFPAYNEEQHAQNTITKAFKLLPQIAQKYEIIVIDDGSKDQTPAILKQLQHTYPLLKVITHSPNQGYGAALKSGFYNSRYQWIAFTDIDGQFDLNELPLFIEKQRQTQPDLVIGYYQSRKVSLTRKLNTWLWQLIVRLLFGLKVRDIDCGFKLINKQVIDAIPRLESNRGAFISSEFLIKAQKYGFKIVETPVHHFPRTAGKGTGA